MKHATFILSYCVPTAFAFALFDIADRGISFRSFGALLPALFLALMASTGLDFVGIRGRYEKKTVPELALRGTLAGVGFIGLTIAAMSLVSLSVAFYSALVFSLVLAPVALLIPFKRSARS